MSYQLYIHTQDHFVIEIFKLKTNYCDIFFLNSQPTDMKYVFFFFR